MKHKHAIEAYKLQALKTGKTAGENPASGAAERRKGKSSGSEGTENPVSRTGHSLEEAETKRSADREPAAQGTIYRGSTINSIVREGGFLRTGFGYKKAAKLLLLLGKDHASQVLKHLLPDEIEKITAEIADIRRIESSEAEKILGEFGALAGEISAAPHGGVDAARDILISTFGKEKADAVMKRISPYAGRRPFSFLNELEFQQIMLLLRKEPVHVMSIIISYLKPDMASLVLESIPPESQALIVRRIARLGKVSPEVIAAIEDSLRERIRTQGKIISEEIDGQKVLAEILKHLPLQDEDRILDSLETKYGSLAQEIRERLFSIEIITDIPDPQLQRVLQKYPDRDIAAILKGKSGELQDKLLRNVSDRRREFIRGERKHLGPMKKSKVDGITKDFLAYVREQAEKGDITLESDELI